MRVLSRLWPYVVRYRARILTGMACLVLVDIVQLMFPLCMAQAVDAIRTENLSAMRAAILLMVAMAVGIALIRYVWRSLLLGASRLIEKDMRDDFFSRLLRAPQAYVDRSRSGDLLSLSTNDIAVIRQFLGLGMMSLCDSVVLISFSVFLMMTLSIPLTLMVAIPLPLVTIAMIVLGTKLHHAHEAVQNQFGDLSARAQEDLYGVKILRACGQEANRHRRFNEESAVYAQNNLSVIRLQGFFYPFLKFLTGSAMALVLWFGGQAVYEGRMTLGQFVAFSEYVAMLSWPLMALGWIINLIQRARASMERINKVFEETDELTASDEESERATTGGQPTHFSNLEIRNLTQTVSTDDPAAGRGKFEFTNVSFSLKKGEWVGIVGRTAAGKSSLISRILRIYEPPPGSIFLDGADAVGLDIHLLRDRISYVPQEGFLFSQSLLSNFKLGTPHARDESVQAIVDAVQIKDEIDRFSDGLKTRVGERGVTLSGGQRQRVAIGRALLKDADFYIFDDPFSSVDLDTEERIFDEMKKMLKGKGVLLISHRIRSISRMDRIVVLDGGRVAETGTHEELLAMGGLYFRFAQAQQIEAWLATACEAQGT